MKSIAFKVGGTRLEFKASQFLRGRLQVVNQTDEQCEGCGLSIAEHAKALPADEQTDHAHVIECECGAIYEEIP